MKCLMPWGTQRQGTAGAWGRVWCPHCLFVPGDGKRPPLKHYGVWALNPGCPPMVELLGLNQGSFLPGAGS